MIVDKMGHFFHTIDKAANQYILHNLEKKYILNNIEIRIIRHLSAHGAKSQQMIADALDVDKALITRNLNHMESLGLLVRESDPSDLRIKRVMVTEAARELKSDIRALEANYYAWLSASMSDKQMQALHDALLPLCSKAENWLDSAKQGEFNVPAADFNKRGQDG